VSASNVVLETSRLVLRELASDDLDALARIYADPDVRRFFPEGTLDREETREELEWIVNVYYRRYGYGLWATVLKETGRLIGRCGLLPWAVVPAKTAPLGLDHAPEDPSEASSVEIELAYLLAREHWGRGLATEAARAIVAFGFERFGPDRIICLIDPENIASLKVASNVGMVVDGDVEIDGDLIPLYAIASTAARERSQD
jgi:ribosomal-protein-alanine N-acetyltransferase